MTAPLSVNVPSDTQVELNDSCNCRCCIPLRIGKKKKKDKVDDAKEEGKRLSREKSVDDLYITVIKSHSEIHFDK